MNIGERIKALRKRAGLTQIDVAERMETSQSNYGMLESGKTELTYSKMTKLAEVFGVSVGELLGIEGVQSSGKEQAREVEALKLKVQDQHDTIELQKKIVVLWEAQNQTMIHLLEQHISHEIYENEIEWRELEGHFFSFIEDIVLYFDFHPKARNLLFHVHKSHFPKQENALNSLLTAYISVFQGRIHKEDYEKLEVKKLIEYYIARYKEESVRNQSEIICFFGTLEISRGKCLENQKIKISILEQLYNTFA